MAIKREDAFERVKKLLKLSEKSSNIHEAQSAAAQAQKIMLEYNIEQINPTEQTVVENKEPIEDFRDQPVETTGRFENWRFDLLGAICRVNSCQALKLRSYVNKITTVLMTGRKTDVQTVKYIYQYLIREIENLCQMQRGRGKKFIASYKSGCVAGVQENLMVAHKDVFKQLYLEASTQGIVALMRVDETSRKLAEKDKELDDFLRGKVKIIKRVDRITSLSGRQAGYEDGKKIRTQTSGPALNSPGKQIS